MNDAEQLVQQAQDALSRALRACDELRRIQSEGYDYRNDNGHLSSARELLEEAETELRDLESWVDDWNDEEEDDDANLQAFLAYVLAESGRRERN
jgi:hypothetical protein